MHAFHVCSPCAPVSSITYCVFILLSTISEPGNSIWDHYVSLLRTFFYYYLYYSNKYPVIHYLLGLIVHLFMVMSNPLTSIGETSAGASWLIRGTRRSPPLLTWSHRYFAFSSPSALCLFDLPSRCFITIKASSVTPALRSRQIERADSRVMRVIFFFFFFFCPQWNHLVTE